MSSSIRIPTRSSYAGESSKAGASSSSNSSYSSSPQTPPQNNSPSSTASPANSSTHSHYRKPSYLSSSFSQQEHTVVNIGDPDGPPRLITCVRASQGYEWNPEIFLPSYVEWDFESFERKRDPVHEIRLSDEEIKNMFPQ